MSGYSGWKDWDPNTHTVTVGKRQSKYKAVRTEIDGITFASKKEAARYVELKRLELAGEITRLELQPRFTLSVPPRGGFYPAGCRMDQDGLVIGAYVGDFAYFVGGPDIATLKRIVEDVKGVKTPLYRWKKKHVEVQYGISIREL